MLLDIQMPGLDGFQVVSRIADMERAPSIVFVTAYDEYAIKAFEVHAVDYILKPVEEKRLAQAIERARRIRKGAEPGPDLKALLDAVGASPKRLAVRQGESLVMVDANDILYATVSEGSIKVVAREVEGSVALPLPRRAREGARPEAIHARPQVVSRQHQPHLRDHALVRRELPAPHGGEGRARHSPEPRAGAGAAEDPQVVGRFAAAPCRLRDCFFRKNGVYFK